MLVVDLMYPNNNGHFHSTPTPTSSATTPSLTTTTSNRASSTNTKNNPMAIDSLLNHTSPTTTTYSTSSRLSSVPSPASLTPSHSMYNPVPSIQPASSSSQLPSQQQQQQQQQQHPSPPQALIVKTSHGKRHRCTYLGCGRDFTRLSNLKAHWRRHSGEQPYSCTHCDRRFRWRSSLKSHELGCVYEFTKRNSQLKWVYLTPQGISQQPTNEMDDRFNKQQ